MTNYHSQLVNHPQPGVVCCDINSSIKQSGKMTFTKVWVTSSGCKRLFFFKFQQPVSPALLEEDYPLQDWGQVWYKRKQIGNNCFSLSFIHSSILFRHIWLHASKHCRWLHSQLQILHSTFFSLRVFVQAKCVLQDSFWHITENRRDHFAVKNVVKELSQMIC